MLMQEIHIKILVWPIRVIVSLSFMIKNTKENDVDVEIQLNILGKHENTKDVYFQK